MFFGFKAGITQLVHESVPRKFGWLSKKLILCSGEFVLVKANSCSGRERTLLAQPFLNQRIVPAQKYIALALSVSTGCCMWRYALRLHMRIAIGRAVLPVLRHA